MAAEAHSPVTTRRQEKMPPSQSAHALLSIPAAPSIT